MPRNQFLGEKYLLLNLSILTTGVPQLADIVTGPTIFVGAGVRVGGGGEGADNGVGGVGRGCCPTGEREDTADPKGRGTGS